MLPWGIDSIKDLIESLALIVGTITVVWGILSYRVIRGQFKFSVMISCIERFQALLPQLSSEDQNTKLLAAKRYVDLCNEELFYFNQGYVPDQVIDEWIEGMAFYLPWFNRARKIVRPSPLQEITEHNLLKEYPRIRHAFTVTRVYNLELPRDKLALLDEVKKNLRRNDHEEHL